MSNYNCAIETILMVHKLFREVCQASGYSADVLRSRNRKREVSYTRHAFAAICRQLFPDSSNNLIGDQIRQPHDMIIYYCREVRDVREKNEFYMDLIKKLN